MAVDGPQVPQAQPVAPVSPQVPKPPLLTGLNNYAQQQRDDDEKAAWKKELKRRRKNVEDRINQRKNVYGYSGNPGTPQDNDPSIASKMRHMGSMDPNVLAGEIIALFIIQFFQSIFQTQYLIQKREFNDAKALDEAKEFNIANGLIERDDNVRVAYQPLVKTVKTTPMLKADGTQEVYNDKPLFNVESHIKMKDGKMEYPAIYPVDGAGNVDYNAVPNTDGTADRFSIRANGYVPVEDWKESHEIQWLWFQKEMSGSGYFNAEQRSKLGYFEQAANKASKKGPDSAQQFAVRPGQAPAPTTTAPKPR